MMMSSNVKKCSVCDSPSMEHCLQIKCKYWAAGSHLDSEKKNSEKKKNERVNNNLWSRKERS